ncbi:MAG: PhnD/SsuA/transferrin family substrate-binding protein [Marinobacter sp.]
MSNLCWCVLAVLMVAAPAANASEPVRLLVQTELQATAVAKNRLQRFLADNGCKAEIVFGQGAPGHLSFNPAPGPGELLLRAVNRNGTAPVPVWVTRATAGVRKLAELQGRDVSLVAGADPVAGQQALAALAQHGIKPTRGQRYEAADYSSALGLLLHNNTHASVSELGFVQPFLQSQSLVISWQGQPIEGAGWYAGPQEAGAKAAVASCLTALTRLKRQDHRQIFQIFPEWVSRFSAPEPR